ncbi:MAG: phosphate/phosphite/phosphonate ABC transporter substrate-binding protein [Gammaproteobacteria bacterium]|nr:phosphate/phosphite/phosphonate ABC transporter substrate-binding protein [Gammaproteobacteria bacterium]
MDTNINRDLPISILASFFILALFTISNPVMAKDGEPIRMGIISLAPPAKIYKQWTEFADYLSEKTGRKVNIVVPRGFKKIKQAVNEKTVDIFYVNSHIFYRLKREGKANPIAQMMNLENSIYSKSVMFVRSNSGIDNLSQLKGEKVAFVAPMGAGGYLAPRAAFYKAGIQTKTETQELFTKNLTSSIHKVLIGDAKAGTMCGLNYNLMSKRVKMGDLKIIASSGKYPENVFGIRSDLSGDLARQLSNVIVGMDTDAKGRKILNKMRGMKILKFVKYSEKVETQTEKLLKIGKFKL